MKKTYTTEKIESIAEKLRSMPVVDKKQRQHSKQESVKMLAKEIAMLRKRGYLLAQISEILRGEGLDVSTPTLKSYLQRSKQTPKKITIQTEKKQELKEMNKDTNPIEQEDIKSEHKVENKNNAVFVPRPDSENI